MRVLIFGATGMLGHMMIRVLGSDSRYETFGAIRGVVGDYPTLLEYSDRLSENVDVADEAHVEKIVANIAPEVIINAVAVRSAGSSPAETASFIQANALWPHRIAAIAAENNIRLCHISSDGVFSGHRGNYSEKDPADACDIYGATKFVGEPQGRNVVNLRTSIIGPELGRGGALLSWFLRQNARISGYSKWIYSGFTTLELSKIIADHVLPRPQLRGIYHLAADPISKFALLCLVSQIYGHDVDIIEDDSVSLDRTLDASRFNTATGYRPPNWPDLISSMHDFQ